MYRNWRIRFLFQTERNRINPPSNTCHYISLLPERWCLEWNSEECRILELIRIIQVMDVLEFISFLSVPAYSRKRKVFEYQRRKRWPSVDQGYCIQKLFIGWNHIFNQKIGWRKFMLEEDFLYKLPCRCSFLIKIYVLNN